MPGPASAFVSLAFAYRESEARELHGADAMGCGWTVPQRIPKHGEMPLRTDSGFLLPK
jgi:hypothetical protein